MTVRRRLRGILAAGSAVALQLGAAAIVAACTGGATWPRLL